VPPFFTPSDSQVSKVRDPRDRVLTLQVNHSSRPISLLSLPWLYFHAHNKKIQVHTICHSRCRRSRDGRAQHIRRILVQLCKLVESPLNYPPLTHPACSGITCTELHIYIEACRTCKCTNSRPRNMCRALIVCAQSNWAVTIEIEYLGNTVSACTISVSTKKVEAVADWPVPTTRKEVRSFVQFCNFYARFIHHFSDLTARLTDLVRTSKPQKVMLTHACLEAFETLKFRLIFAPCLILPEVSSDATFTVATYASTMGIAAVMLQDQGGGLQPVSYYARKLNSSERGNTYTAYDLEALAVCEDV
jgi:hypothetical protein